MLNLDTHILIKALEGSLSERERSLLTADGEWSISAIVIWEMAMLQQRGRIRFHLYSPQLEKAFERLHVWPLDRAVCQELQSLDFRSDPADKLIAATSLAPDIPLVTRDERIRQSRLVRCL